MAILGNRAECSLTFQGVLLNEANFLKVHFDNWREQKGAIQVRGLIDLSGASIKTIAATVTCHDLVASDSELVSISDDITIAGQTPARSVLVGSRRIGGRRLRTAINETVAS